MNAYKLLNKTAVVTHVPCEHPACLVGLQRYVSPMRRIAVYYAPQLSRGALRPSPRTHAESGI